MTDNSNSLAQYQRIVELASSNISGPIGRKLVAKAQHSLIDNLLQKGLISEQDALDLKM